ncbi:hypothetical protein QOT17_009508 [Balamuthia mandrillaris]
MSRLSFVLALCALVAVASAQDTKINFNFAGLIPAGSGGSCKDAALLEYAETLFTLIANQDTEGFMALWRSDATFTYPLNTFPETNGVADTNEEIRFAWITAFSDNYDFGEWECTHKVIADHTVFSRCDQPATPLSGDNAGTEWASYGWYVTVFDNEGLVVSQDSLFNTGSQALSQGCTITCPE